MAQYCSFYLDDRAFGLDILSIQEIIRLPDITRVPDAPAFVAGLANLRGQIVVAVDLRILFGLPPAAASLQPVNIILSSDGEALSLVVDRAGDVLDFGEAAMVPPPGQPRGQASDLIMGVFMLKNELLHILDIQAIFTNRDISDPKPVSKAV
jgi:purine-binding chemotaxis protein CheW